MKTWVPNSNQWERWKFRREKNNGRLNAVPRPDSDFKAGCLNVKEGARHVLLLLFISACESLHSFPPKPLQGEILSNFGVALNSRGYESYNVCRVSNTCPNYNGMQLCRGKEIKSSLS